MQTVWTTLPRLLEIAAMERRVAATAGCAYFSELDAMGGPGSMAEWALETPARGRSDRTHFSRLGYTQLGEALAADLVRAYDGFRFTAGSGAKGTQAFELPSSSAGATPTETVVGGEL